MAVYPRDFPARLSVAVLAGTLLSTAMVALATWAGPQVSLPERIGSPTPWTSEVTASPLGSASVVFSANGWWLLQSSHGSIGLVGASSDDYRVLHGDLLPAGMGAVLAPDGRVLATENGLINLATGGRTPYPKSLSQAGEIVIPQAWSPDGRHLAVATYLQPEGDPITSEIPPEIEAISIMDVVSDGVVTLQLPEPAHWLPGWEAAFSPDGSELAYQAGGTIEVATVAGRARSSFSVADGVHLAGKGAFTPDRRGLLLVSGANCSCGDGYAVRWTVRHVDAVTGSASGPVYSFDGAYAVRVLGLWKSKDPVVAVYRAEPGTSPSIFDDDVSSENLVSLDDVKTVDVIDVGATSRMTLLSGQSRAVESVDLADDVLAVGVERLGDPPLFTSAFLVDSVGIAAVGLVLGAGMAVTLWFRRRRGRRRAEDRQGAAAPAGRPT